MSTDPYSEFAALSQKLKSKEPFVFPEPRSVDEEDKENHIADKWSQLPGKIPCPSLEAGDGMGVIEHSATAESNVDDIAAIKVVSMRSLPPEYVKAYVSQINEPHLSPQYAKECLDSANLVFFALDRNTSGAEGLIGVIAADISDLYPPMGMSSANTIEANLNIEFELVHIKERARNCGLGTTLSASLGYDLGVSLKELLLDHRDISKSLDAINVMVNYQSEFASGQRAANALCTAFECMFQVLVEQMHQIALSNARDNGEQIDNIIAFMKAQPTPSIRIDQINEY